MYQKIKIFLIVIGILSSSSIVFADDLTVLIYTSNQKDNFEPKNALREFIYGEPAYSAIFVKGFQRDAEKKVDLASDIKLIDPNGNIILEEKNYATSNVEIPDNAEFAVLNNSFDVTFEWGDPLGMHTISVDVRDNISGVSKSSETTLLVFDTDASRKRIMAPVRSVKDLDEIWAEYFRSKHPWAIKKIISALGLQEETSRLENKLIAGAAQWSLESNAKQNPDILLICKQSLNHTEGTTYRMLREIINKAESVEKSSSIDKSNDNTGVIERFNPNPVRK